MKISCCAFKPPISLTKPFGGLESRQKFKWLTAYSKQPDKIIYRNRHIGQDNIFILKK